jgi:hypothetical protein
MAAELLVLKGITSVVVKDWCGNVWEGVLTPCIYRCM